MSDTHTLGATPEEVEELPGLCCCLLMLTRSPERRERWAIVRKGAETIIAWARSPRYQQSAADVLWDRDWALQALSDLLEAIRDGEGAQEPPTRELSPWHRQRPGLAAEERQEGHDR